MSTENNGKNGLDFISVNIRKAREAEEILNMISTSPGKPISRIPGDQLKKLASEFSVIIGSNSHLQDIESIEIQKGMWNRVNGIIGI